MSTFTLGIIPARAESKGVKKKNLRPVGGKPLIHHAIEGAKRSEELSQFVISTDSAEIASVAEEGGGTVEELRPAELATDTAPTIDVVRHVVSRFEPMNDKTVDAIVLLQPTSPFRTAADIDGSLRKYNSHEDANSLVSCYESTDVHPNIMYERSGERLVPLRREAPERRQDFEPVYVRNGAIYVASRGLVMEDNRLYSEEPLPFEMPKHRSINIDEPFDLKLANFIWESDGHDT